MSKAIREKQTSDPFLLGLDSPSKKNGTPKLEKTEVVEKTTEDPFMLGVEVKKKETTSPELVTPSEPDATVSETGTENISPSPSELPSEKKETKKQRYQFVELATTNDILDEYAEKTKSLAAAFRTDRANTKNSRNFHDYIQSREGKVGKIINDIISKGQFNKEDINYLIRVAPNAAKQIIGAILPDSTPQNIISTDNINRFIEEGAKIVDKQITQSKVVNSFKIAENANLSLQNIGIKPEQLQNDQYASQINDGVISQRNKELEAIEKEYPIREIPKVSGRQRYYEKERLNEAEYNEKKAAINQKYGTIQNSIGINKAFSYAKANPTLTPLEIGEQWLKYSDPDTYKLWVKGGKKGAINRDIADVGVRALYANGNPGSVELAKADEANLDFQYPDKAISETYHRLGAELYKGQNWFLNAAPSVKQLDEAAKQLPEKNREIYNRFIRERERKNVGTDVPMSGLVNKVGEGIASTATETWKGLGDLLNVRSDKKVAFEALNEGYDTDFKDIGTYGPAKQRLKELNKKQKNGEKLNEQEISEKQDLETYTGVRSTAQEIIDGTGNLTGQVIFQALGTKGLSSVATAGIRTTGLLKGISVGSGLATEEAIAARAFDFGISKSAITNISAAAVAYASSYDAAKRQAFRLMPSDEDADKRNLYSTFVAGVNAATERIFKDEKVLTAFNRQISPGIQSLVNRLSAGEISREALAPALTKIIKNSASFGNEMGKANLKESTEEFAASVGESVATSILAPAKYNEQQAFDDAVNTFTTTFLHGGLVSGAAAINSYRSNHISIPTLSKLGVDQNLTQGVRDFINGQLLSRNMTQEEADSKFQILNTASRINTEVMPQISEISPDLPQKAKEKYAVQLLNEKILTAQAEETKDQVLKSALEKKVSESEKIRKDIIDKKIFVDDDFSVKTADQINQEQDIVEKEDVTERTDVTKDQMVEDIFKRASEKGGEGVARSLDESKKEESVQFLKDQALGTPNSLLNQLSNDEELVTDVISANSQEAIQKSIDRYESELKQEGNTEERIEEIDRHLSLLDKGLQKNISKPKTQTNENEEKIGQESSLEKEDISKEKVAKEANAESGLLNQEGAVEATDNEAAPIQENVLSNPVISKVDDGDLYEFTTQEGKVAGVLISPTEFRIDGISAAEVGKGQGSKIFEGLISFLKNKGVTRLTTESAGEGAKKMHQKAIEKGLLTRVSEDGRSAVFEINNESINKRNESSQTKTEKQKVRVSAEQLEQSQPKKEPQKPPTRKDLSDKLRGLLGSDPLRLEGISSKLRISFQEIGLIPSDTMEQAIDKLISYGGEFTDIFKAIKADPNFSKIKLELVESLEGNDRGLYYPQGHDKAGLLQISNKGNVYYTAAHELLHFFTLDSAVAEQVKDTAPYKALEDLYNFIALKKEKPIASLGNVSMKNYGLTDVKEFMAEMFINPEFREYVSDVFADSKDEIFKQSQYIKDSKKGATIIGIIADLFRELFSKVFPKEKSDITFDEQKSVIDNAVQIATDLFFSGSNTTKNSYPIEILDIPDEITPQVVERALKGGPIIFNAYRVESSDNINEKTGAFFGDEEIVDNYLLRRSYGWMDNSYSIKGDKYKYQVTLNNPLVIFSKEKYVRDLAKDGDEEARKIIPNWKEEDVLKWESSIPIRQFDEFITKKAKENGHDGIVSELEYQIFDKKSFKKISDALPDPYGKDQTGALKMPDFERAKIISDFVKSSLEQGATPEDIKAALIENGLSEQEAQSFIDNNVPPSDTEVPDEQQTEEEKPSGIRKALVSSQLIADVNLNKISDKDMMALGRKILDSGEVKPEALVRKILKENVGVLTPAEVVGMITYKADLDNSLREAYQQFNERWESGQGVGALGVEIADLEQKIHDFDVAAVITANQQSMAFRLRQYMLDRDYNVTTQIEKYKKNNNGYIPPEVEAKFRELDRELKAVKDKLTKAEKKLAEKEDQQAVDNIAEDVAREKLFTQQELEQKIKEGVQKEIDEIHKKLSPEKKSLANKAIDALDKFQKKLRGKSYSDATGMIAIVDTGITVIKNAIKTGIAVADAIEMGIGRIKELLAKKGINTWAKEDEFRQDMLEGFEAEGISTSRKPKDKATVNDDGSVTIPNQMLRDLVERGLNTIEELTDAVHAEVIKDLPDVTKRQVRDYITEYGKKINSTADEIQKQINTAKRVGRLLSELEDLQNQKRKEKNADSRYKLSEKERELKRKIRILDKGMPLSDSEKDTKDKGKLAASKERVKNKIAELEERLKNKDFAKKKKVEPLKDQELIDLETQKEKLQEEFDKEQYKAELKQRTFWKKVEDIALELTSGLVRGLVASVDLSAGFVQGLWRLFSNPINSMNAFGTMFKHLVSENGSKEYMTKLKASPEYNLMRAAKLAIDDQDGKASAKEGLFISNWINHIWNFMAKVISLNNPTVKNFIKKINPYEASKRAFDGYVNSIRVQSFVQLAKQLEDKGYTFESDPEVYKKAADFVNTTTGRASLGAIESNSRWLNTILFAPRKVASEVKLFTPYAFAYYAKMPPAVRRRALINLSKFLGGFFLTNSLAWAALKDDDDEDDNFWNPTSSDFLTHKIGNKRISIAGGAKSMITFQSRLLTGKFTDQYGKTTKLGERFGKPINSRFDLFVRFILGKASPAIAVAAKKLDEKKGMEVDDSELIKDVTVPMWMQDLKDLYKDDPVAVGVILSTLAFFGANTRVVPEKPTAFKKEELKDPTLKYFIERGAEMPETKPGNIEIPDEAEGKIKKLADYGEEKVSEFNDYRKEALKEELSNLKETGHVYVDKFGRISTTDDGEKEETSLDDLTEDQWKKVMSILGGKATKKAKEETFKKEEE